MIKVIFVFLAAIALMFYVTRNEAPSGHTTSSEPKDAVAGKLQRLAPLPDEVHESSGIVALPQKDHFLTHNDAGNQPFLYEINAAGKLLKSIPIQEPNKDWEDLTKDDKGNIYIADTGNNNNKRKDLTVYKMSLNNPEKVAAIHFTYEDQYDFPPKKKDMNFDSEALFWYDGHLYLITKDRGRKETANVYELPDSPGTYKAKKTGSVPMSDLVTGADISPDKKMVALLSEGKLHLFRNLNNPAAFYKENYENLPLPEAGQTEGVAFEDDNTLVITSEGGNIYRYRVQ
ncbi:SdiA-regulated domain-containing protein [Pontibacter liquoris]|uniref:SdiA-regulated domain-containing protein n=1 Tax=Pontibacter liquoris TaxID=2905677 RepID=UPI001FA7AD19|nr:SdiA-regulated domain-containing protein [Pontibacter liquoris]